MEIITCERDPKTKITKTTCVARQRIVAKNNFQFSNSGWGDMQKRDCKNSCDGCETGLRLYRESLKGEQIKNMVEKPTKKGLKFIEDNMQKMLQETTFTTKQIKKRLGLAPTTAMVDYKGHEVKKISHNKWVLNKKIDDHPNLSYTKNKKRGWSPKKYQ